MGWEDRPYYRDRGAAGRGLWWLFSGSFRLYTAFGIRVRVHAALIVFMALYILLGGGKNAAPMSTRAIGMAILGVVILLHEYGHCFAARAVGGSADEILMWPLGGLAYTSPPHRPFPNFITSAAGPAVNLLICIICGTIVSWNQWHPYGMVSLDPFNYHTHASNLLCYYLFWVFMISYDLLLFNLLPIYPLDGGQMLQATLWPKLGFRRSTHVACVVGMIGSVVLGLYGLLKFNDDSILLICVAASCFLYCRSKLIYLRETAGEDEFGLGGDSLDFSASLAPDLPKKKRKVSRWVIRRLRRQAQRDADEQRQLDAILAKVSAHGMHSLTWSERRALKRATQRQRKRELEPTRGSAK